MGKVLTVIFFVLSLPVIILLVLVGMALFVPAKQCPEINTDNVVADLDKKSKDLEKTGIVTITNAEAAYILQNSANNQFEDLRVCFTEGRVNVSGKIPVGNFKPTFYLTTSINSNPLQTEDVKVTIGGLGFLSGLFGSIAQGAVNDQFKQIPPGETYQVTFKEGQAEVKLEKSKTQPRR